MDMARARMLAGQCDEAARTAKEARELRQRGRNMYPVGAEWMTAMVAAWCGHEEEAVAQLETLSTIVPGLPPAAIALDPVFTVPLAGNARFTALKARLEQQMRDTKLD